LGDLSPSLVPEIFRLTQRSQETILFGYGEPLLSEVFYHLLGGLQSARCSFTTNGLLLTGPILTQILRSARRPLHHVTFSIDGVHPSTYQSIRERSDCESVWGHLRSLSEFKARSASRWPEIRVNFVAMRRNLEELPEMVMEAASQGVSQINVFHMVVWDESYRAESLIHFPELTKQVFHEARKRARALGIGLDLPTVISADPPNRPQDSRGRGTPRCYQPWSYSYIRNDGIVQACCFSDNYVMGNLHEKSFEEIWNNEPYQALRASVNRAALPDCRRCEFRFRYRRSPDDTRTYLKLEPRKK
jgi:radical SAM protein with 4Fe4S-binding SPASM domain